MDSTTTNSTSNFNPPTPPKWSLEERESKRRKLVGKDLGLRRVQDALEHILVTGAKVRRDRWRRHQFQIKEERRSSCEGCKMDCPPRAITDKNGSRKRQRTETGVYHAEDLRVYGKRYNRHLLPFRFPSKTSGRRNSNGGTDSDVDDSEWNLEHGDSIPPVLFRKARLSQEYPTPEQAREFLSKAAQKPEEINAKLVDEIEVPRALIERCWERAVHAASRTLVTPVTTSRIATTRTTTTTTTTTESRKGSSRPGDSTAAFDDRDASSSFPLRPKSQDESKKRCESLGIDLETLRSASTMEAAAARATTTATRTTAAAAAAEPGTPNKATSMLSCPRCTRAFASSRALDDHYYGTTEVVGCCLPWIRPRHLDLIRRILQDHVQSQTDHLWSLVLSQAKVAAETSGQSETSTSHDLGAGHGDGESDSDDSFRSSTNVRRGCEKLGWRDVRRYMETAWKDSIEIPTEETNCSRSDYDGTEANTHGHHSSSSSSSRNKNHGGDDHDDDDDDTFGSDSDDPNEKETQEVEDRRTEATDPNNSASKNCRSISIDSAAREDSDGNGKLGAAAPNERSNFRMGPERHPVQESLRILTDAKVGDWEGEIAFRDLSPTDTTTDPETKIMGEYGNPPLVLNPMILEAVNRRLIDRYADVPY